jgi:hypothetical protein
MSTFMDKLLLVCLIIFTMAGFLYSREFISSGNLVKISLDNKPVYNLNLSQDREVSVRGPLGNNVIEIKGSKVRMKEASCPTKLCVHQGWIESGAIICLPNKIIVMVSRDKQHDKHSQYPEYDAVSK